MKRGRFVETGDVDLVLKRPVEEYTKELLAAVPEIPR
jgi:ABC-type oligopeptide transport system ATPase subunit